MRIKWEIYEKSDQEIGRKGGRETDRHTDRQTDRQNYVRIENNVFTERHKRTLDHCDIRLIRE